ncbi:hypothetical protein [Kitasatospora sp. NPDC002965]|uniref:hypothetical protein n=1 Tax=Kitasatospora sp. NPDC002965 TaxID=3154775 RepID=UPI0033B65F64
MPPVAFTARITEFDGTRRTAALSAAEADAVIDSALLFDEAAVTAGGERHGTLTITHSISHPPSACGTLPASRRWTAVLEAAHPVRPTLRQYEDLALLAAWEEEHPEGAMLTPAGAAATRFEHVPPASARHLLAAGWLTPDGGGAHGHVTVSYAGRIAMTLYQHRLRTGVVGAEAWASGAISGGWVACPPLYVEGCTCGWRGPAPSGDAAIVRGHGRDHRQGELQRLFVV